MNDKMREALNNALIQFQQATGAHAMGDHEMEEMFGFPVSDFYRSVFNILATPPTEQTGRVMDLEEAKKVISAFAAMNGYSVDFVPMDTPAVSLPSVEEIMLAMEDPRMIPIETPRLQAAAEAVLVLLSDRLGKPIEVDFSHWIKTQGLDAWAADHSAVLRNLKAYLKAEGVRVKE